MIKGRSNRGLAMI